MHDAVHDNLTGLPNRELFMNRLEGMIALAKAEEKIRPTVLVIDIDRFKQVNDGLGISAGDTILLTVARRLHRLLKPRDARPSRNRSRRCRTLSICASAKRRTVRACTSRRCITRASRSGSGRAATRKTIVAGADVPAAFASV